MGLLDKLWDDVLAGPQPEKGLGRLRRPKLSLIIDDSRFDEDRSSSKSSSEILYSHEAVGVTQSLAVVDTPAIISLGLEELLPSTPSGCSNLQSPSFTSPLSRPTDNSWRSIFHLGSNRSSDRDFSVKYDDRDLNSPTVYDWLVISALER